MNKAIEIVEGYSVTTGISVSKILGQGRSKSVVLTRRCAIKDIRKQTNLSTPEIGRLFDNRDHTTILHYLKT